MMDLVKMARAHAGWTEAEEALLFDLADRARAAGRPLKSVFDEMAAASGRRPNSVRNFYSARVKSGGDAGERHSPSFVPFTEAESERLMETVLLAQASGESVRSCTLRLGGGQQRAMLRYQNKYRALVRSDPTLVRRVMEKLRREGQPVFDPYAAPEGRHAGRPRKRERPCADIAHDVAAALEGVEGLDVPAFLTALGKLALAATGGAERTHQLEKQLRCERERNRMLLNSFSELLRVNRAFLQSPVKSHDAKIAVYLSELETSLRPCEKLLPGETG